MRDLFEVQRQLVPDMIDVFKRRYSILNHILLSNTTGRRTLAAALGLTERVLRSEVDFLRAQGLIEVGNVGMTVTPLGDQLLSQMEPMIKELFGLADLEDQLCQRFGLKRAIVVPGNSDQSPMTKKEIGRAGGQLLRKIVSTNDIVAITGGSTVAALAATMTPHAHFKGVWFIPARGGMEESVELQANTIASQMAQRTGAQYRLLHAPEQLGEEAFQTLSNEPSIQTILEMIRNARIVVHGIGDAVQMARRRKMDEDLIAKIEQGGAQGEAFGYYFDPQGTVVYRMPTIGLRLEDIKRIEWVVAVAGGESKASAIASVLRCGKEDALVTDEAAALKLLELTSN